MCALDGNCLRKAEQCRIKKDEDPEEMNIRNWSSVLGDKTGNNNTDEKE